MADVLAPIDRRLAARLLAIGAVSLSPDQPYTWASGRRAPIYCDNRLTIAYPAVRRLITDGFVSRLDEVALRPDVVVGTATAGIPHAAWLADRLDLPLAYVRAKPKEHGRSNQIEGRIEAGQRVVVVEDLVSTGLSSLAVVDALRTAGADVAAVLAIFTYGLPEATAAFEQGGLTLHALTSYDVLIDVAAAEGRLEPAALASLQAWRADPRAWSVRHGGAG